MNFLNWARENGKLPTVIDHKAAIGIFEEYLYALKEFNPKYVVRIKYRGYLHKQVVEFSKAVKFRSLLGEFAFSLGAMLMVSRWFRINGEGSQNSDTVDEDANCIQK